MNYPPASSNAPPTGVSLQFMAGDPNAPSGYSSAPGYPPATGYPPQNTGYPPAGYPQPVRGQPQPGGCYPPPGGMPEANWMPIPTGIPVCPPGLEYLTMIDQLLVHQKVEMLEVVTGFETKNKYTIKNSLGQKVYAAKEDTDCCTRMCCGPIRPFEMKVKDNAGNEVIHFSRDLRCDSCFCPCFLQRLEVMSPPGTLIGTVEQEWAIFTPQFRLNDASGTTILRIEGPFCTCSCCSDVVFEVLSPSGVRVGKICKQWSGLVREAFTNADHFGITFPMDLDVKAKAIVLGALFLIDYMYFENTGNENQNCMADACCKD